MKIAVSNSSPLILLAKIHMLDMLFYFFDQILIPQNNQIRQFHGNNLHIGEIEVIKLALSLPHNVILLDDEEARKLARALNMRVKGTLGILIDYRKAEKIDRKKAIEILEQLNKIMYLSADVYHFIEKNV